MTLLAKASPILRRAGLTLVLAFLVAWVAGSYDPDIAGILFVPAWAALFFGFSYLERQLNFRFPRIFRRAFPSA